MAKIKISSERVDELKQQVNNTIKVSKWGNKIDVDGMPNGEIAFDSLEEYDRAEPFCIFYMILHSEMYMIDVRINYNAEYDVWNAITTDNTGQIDHFIAKTFGEVDAWITRMYGDITSDEDYEAYHKANY